MKNYGRANSSSSQNLWRRPNSKPQSRLFGSSTRPTPGLTYTAVPPCEHLSDLRRNVEVQSIVVLEIDDPLELRLEVRAREEMLVLNEEANLPLTAIVERRIPREGDLLLINRQHQPAAHRRPSRADVDGSVPAPCSSAGCGC